MNKASRARVRSLRGAACALAVGLTLVAGRTARAGDAEELEFARSQIDAGQYQEAATRFKRLLDPKGTPCPTISQLSTDGCRLTDPATIPRAHSYNALALALAGKSQEAKEEFKVVLEQNPSFSPSPALFPQQVIELFLQVKDDLQATKAERDRLDLQRKKEAEAAQKRYDQYVSEIEKLAATETITVERSRWIAAIPFGVGQFQNDAIGLGIMFLALETAATTSSIVTSVIVADRTACQAAQDPSCYQVSSGQVATDEVQAFRIANIASFSTLGALIIAGILEAELSFEPAATRKATRKLPARPPKPGPVDVTVSGVPDAPDAAGLGVTIRF